MDRTDARYRLLLGSAASALAMATLTLPAAAQESELDQAVSEENQIVVTGSRIVRRDFEANSPIVTIDQDSIENRSSIGVEDALNELPQFTPAGTGALSSDAGAAFAGPDAAPGAATVDLRGIGTNRTLVLINGRRAQPVNAELLVDLNTIPSAAIENVEVITGGAAAVYGADAIAGVVNFIMRDDFEGIELDGQVGIAEVGDAETYEVSALMGGNFADGRGNAMVGATWAERKEAYNRNRDFYTDAWRDPATSGGGGMPLNEAIIAGRNYAINPDGSLFNPSDAANPLAPYTGPTNNLAGGSGFKLNPPNAAGLQEVGYNDPDVVNNIPLSRWSIFGSAHYEVTENIEAFIEGRFTHSDARAQSLVGTAESLWAIRLPYDQANDDPDSPTFGADQSYFHPVPAALADVLNGAGVSSWTLNRGLNFAGRLYIETASDVFQITTGLRGPLGIKDWSWEVYGTHGNTNVVTQQPTGAISHDNLQQIFSGTVDGGGRSISILGPWSQGWSNGAIFNPQTCTSGIPLFNPDGSVPTPVPGTAEGVVVSDDCRSYITLELNNVTSLTQNVVEATMQGGLIDWWAGEVRFAVGATYRDNDFSFFPDTGNSAQQQSTNVVNQIALPAPTAGRTSVKEVYGELLVPLLTDLPAVQQFDLELGGRYSDYNSAGGLWTFKILGDWEVTDFLRFRGGFQRANRAPNVFEQFAPIAGQISSSADACVNIEGYTAPYGNRMDNPNIINVQNACEALILRDGGFDYTTLAEDPTAVAQDPALFPDIDLTRLSNLRTFLGYNQAFPFSIALTQGNPDLGSEIADTITIGGVLQSPFSSPGLDRMTLSVDYYSIDLEDAIGQPNGQEIYSQCFDPQYNPLMASAAGSLSGEELIAGNPYCNLINRYPFDLQNVRAAPQSGTDRTFQAQFINKGGIKTSGLDVTLNWLGDLEGMGLGIPGSISFFGTANVLLSYEESPFPGAPYVEYKGTLENQAFDFKLFGTLSYLFDDGSIGFRGRYLPSIDPSPFANTNVVGTRSYTEFSVFGRYVLSEALELRAGVDNLFNAQPRVVGATDLDANTDSTIQVYDGIGRRYYFGLRFRM